MKNIIFILILLLFTQITFAGNNVDFKLEKQYESFILKIEKKYNTEDLKIFLNKVNSKIDRILLKKNISLKKRKLIGDFRKLINETLYDIYIEGEKLNLKQKIIEKYYIQSLNDSLVLPDTTPSYINNLKSSKIKLIAVNDLYEFSEDNKVKKFLFKRYYTLNQNTYKGLKDKAGYILYISSLNKYLFIDTFTIEKRIPYSEAFKYFKFYSTDNNKIFKEPGLFYAYNIPYFSFIENKYGFYLDSLESLGIDNEAYGIHKNNSGKYSFIKIYTKIELIDSDIIFGITEKERFLENVKSDKRSVLDNTNDTFSDLKKITEELTFGLTKEEKIKRIYSWVLENIEYTTEYSSDEYRIYSGILTYKNKNGVCEGYAKLMAYMLNFAGIKDVEVLRGKVIDAQDFPEVGHAWIKIGDLYYDPTFDDPIGAIDAKEFNKYKYYGLPRDIFYTNRYDDNLTPKNILNTSLDYRKSLITQNLYNLSDKYIGSNHLLLKDSIFRKKYGISSDKKITLEFLSNIIDIYIVNDGSFIIKGEKKFITNINYFTVTNDNLNSILGEVDFDLDSRYIFKWYESDGSFTYRISETIELS